jgi:hypothetical protein
VGLGARIGVDVGGTFTDVVLALTDGRIHVNKTTTTPRDPGEGVAAGVAAVLRESGLDPRAVNEVVHGTTVASNTILQKVGARTGLLTTRGFRDVLEIGRIRTPGMFDLAWVKPEPLVPRRWRLEANERVAADGSVVTPLDEASVRAAAAFFQAERLEAVAVCFINSYVNDAHERRAAAILREAASSLLCTASHEVLPEIDDEASLARLPRSLILRQPSARIVHRDAVRRVRSPFPKNEIAHVLARAIGERRHQHPRLSRAQPVRDPPGCGLLPIRKIERPPAGQLRKFDTSGFANIRACEVNDVRNIDVVSNHGQWIESVCKAVARLDDGAFDRRGQIKRGNAAGVETASRLRGAIPRKR